MAVKRLKCSAHCAPVCLLKFTTQMRICDCFGSEQYPKRSYHHHIASINCSARLTQEINTLKKSLVAYLAPIQITSKIKYHANFNVTSQTTDNKSILFVSILMMRGMILFISYAPWITSLWGFRITFKTSSQ